jgi:hypothetical protein
MEGTAIFRCACFLSAQSCHNILFSEASTSKLHKNQEVILYFGKIRALYCEKKARIKTSDNRLSRKVSKSTIDELSAVFSRSRFWLYVSATNENREIMEMTQLVGILGGTEEKYKLQNEVS